MGSNASKSKPIENVQIGNIPTTPILTPEAKKKIYELDPRSPSTHLSRTPVQLLSASAEKIENLKDDELYEPEGETPAKSKTILLGIDPRSPTAEFTRTPIVINIDESGEPKKIHNKNLDKVRRSNIIATPKSTTEKICNIVPPKLLESSPIQPKPERNKRKSFVGLLETNIDFTETDLDAVLQEKCKIRESGWDRFSTPSGKICVGIVNNEKMDPRSPSIDFLRTPIQFHKIDVENDLEVNDIDSEEIVVELRTDDGNDKLEIEEIIQEICDIVEVETANGRIKEDFAEESQFVEAISALEVPTEEEEVVNNEVTSEDLEISTETKSAPVTPPTSTNKEKSMLPPSPTQKQTKSAPVTPPVVNITADVNELDKKLTNLIYQDEDIIVCPRIVKLKEHGNRSPLRNCNRAEPERRKSVQKLRVSDKPRKFEYTVSKIPLFKEKGRNQVQCENTPPRNMEKRTVKARKSQWDNADKTLII